MILFTLFWMACVFGLGGGHHCTKTNKWNEIRSVLSYLGYQNQDPHHLIMEVIKRQRGAQSGTELYKKLAQQRCNDKRYPRFHTLEEFIAKDASIKRLIYNSTYNHLRVLSSRNFEYVTTLALSMSLHLDKYACGYVEDTNHVFNLLGGNHRDLDLKHLFNMVLRHFNQRDDTDKRSVIKHTNRLQCLSLGMVEEEIHQLHKTTLHHPPKRSVNENDEQIQYEANYDIDGFHADSEMNSINETVVDPVEKSDLNTLTTKHHHAKRPKPTKNPSHHHHRRTNQTPRHQHGPTISSQNDQAVHDTHTLTTARHHKLPMARPTLTFNGHRPNNHQPPNHHKQSPAQRKQMLIFTQKLFVTSSAIVSAILRGVNIYPDRRSCMIDHLEYIMHRYGHKRNLILNETGLHKLITDIVPKALTDRSELSINARHNQMISPGHHDSSCKPKHTYSRLSVEVDNTEFYINFSELLEPKDLLTFEKHNGKYLNKVQFLDVCPSIIYNLLQRATDMSSDQTEDNTLRIPTPLETYGLGTTCVFIISLCSLLGALFVKITKKMIREYAMGMLLSLSIGCLVGDAVLHLIPDILLQDEDEVNTPRIPETLTKQCALLASIYGFFLLELTLSLIKSSREDQEMKELSDQNLENECKSIDCKTKAKSSLAWMVVIGDAIHNFADGLAIGAAFNKDITVGLSTSIAVFCHELPHELGDFAALISTGMSIKKAIFWNFISSLTAFGGLYIGIVVSSNDVARSWIFSVGAGMFIYVAMANLVPEVQSYLKKSPNLCMFLSLNIGLLLGYVSMLLLAVYEDDLKLT